EYLSERKLGSGQIADARAMQNRCSGNSSAFNPTTGPAWNGWGADLTNTRFQTAEAARLTADRVKSLKLKWAFAFPGATVMYGQPTIVGGRLFAGGDTGYVYALD